MRPRAVYAAFFALYLFAGQWFASAQVLPNLTRTGSLQANQPPVLPVPTVMRPAEGEVVVGDLGIAVQVPPQVTARKYSMEAAYWDTARGNWNYPGTLGPDFLGGQTATTRIAAEVRVKLGRAATRWKIHVRVSDPPGGWGPWREFTWQPGLPSSQNAANVSPSSGAPNTIAAAPQASAVQQRVEPAGSGSKPPEPGATPGIMVPGAQSGATGTLSNASRRSAAPAVPVAEGATETTGNSSTHPGIMVPGQGSGRQASVSVTGQTPPQTAVITAPSSLPPAVSSSSRPLTRRSASPTPAGPAQTGSTSVSSAPSAAAAVTGKASTTPPPPAAPPTPTLTPAEARKPAPISPAQNRAVQSGPANLISRTKLRESDGHPMAAYNQWNYVDGPISVDWAQKNLLWWFKFTTTATTAVPGKARWEVSRAPFPAGAWKPVPGFGYSGPTGGTEFTIDLGSYAPRPPDWPGTTAAVRGQLPAAQTRAGGNPLLPGFPQTPEPSNRVKPGGLQNGQASSGQNVALKSGPALAASLSLYVRVVPLDKTGHDADLPSNAVELRFGPGESAPPFNVNPQIYPQVALISYRPVKGYAFDWQCWVKATQDIKVADITSVIPGHSSQLLAQKPQTYVLYHKGDTRSTCQHDDSILDDFIDAIGGFIGMLKDFVNWVSNCYDSLKKSVVSAIGNAICNGDGFCESVIQQGLNAGLVALGMPPELPDFDQLEAMGEGYLVDTIAANAAASGIPFSEDAAKLALQEMIKKGKEASTSGGSGATLWIPDPGHQYKPLLLMVNVANPSRTASTPAMYLEITETGGAHYQPASVAFPALAPGKSFKLAVALKPVDDPKAWMNLLPSQEELSKAVTTANVIAEKQNEAYKAWQAWGAKYTKGSLQFHAALKSPPFVRKDLFNAACKADQPTCTAY
jgi:hypothetical protein